MPTISQTTLNDRDEIFHLANSFATSFVVACEAFNESLPTILQSESATLLVAVENHQILAYLLGVDHPTLFANGKVVWVEEIMVNEEFRRHGIGRQLMEAFESWAKAHHTKLIALATWRATDFYQSLGYEESARYFRKLL